MKPTPPSAQRTDWRGWRAALLWFADSQHATPSHETDGLLVTARDADGTVRVQAVGHYASLIGHYPDLAVTHFAGHLIAPGFVDLHIHYPQTDVIASPAEGLRDRDTAQSLQETEQLIQRWHGGDRLGYAITPRFAPTSTQAQLHGAGELAQQHPTVWIQSHVAENLDEVRWAHELFPHARSYLDVYTQAGLLRERAVYAHCIHLDDTDRACMAERGAVAAISPTSNLFLGSGFFDYASATPLLARRTAQAESLAEWLFALVVLGDDRLVAHTVVQGETFKLGPNLAEDACVS